MKTKKLFTLFLIFLILPTIYAQGFIEPEHSNVPTDEPVVIPPQISEIDKFIEGLFTLDGLFLIIVFLLLLLIPIFFIYYTIKNKMNKKKFILSLISTIIISLDYLLFVWVWGGCIGGCDMFGESLITMFFLLPIAGIIIVPWIVYWVISYFKNK